MRRSLVSQGGRIAEVSGALIASLEARLTDYLEELRELVNTDSGAYYKEGADAVVDLLEQRLQGLDDQVQRFLTGRHAGV